ncbi:MAG TPA: hypothetical protein VMK42_21635 [Anaeromyxobacteraceae bacterium]|nr:hypothetical protein [Anaeromyxobacteraceae bacterium]
MRSVPPAAAFFAALLLAPEARSLEPARSPLRCGGHAEAASAMAMARAARLSRERARAEDWLSLAVAADPDWILPRVELADLLLADESGPGAATSALRLLSAPSLQAQTNPRLYRLLGQARARLGDVNGAIAAWARSLELSDDLDLRLLRAALLRDQPGGAAEAVIELERVRDARPGDRAARSLLAEAYEAAGRRAEAEAELLWLASAPPPSAAALRRLARFYERGNDRWRAEEAERAAQSVEKPSRRMRPL